MAECFVEQTGCGVEIAKLAGYISTNFVSTDFSSSSTSNLAAGESMTLSRQVTRNSGGSDYTLNASMYSANWVAIQMAPTGNNPSSGMVYLLAVKGKDLTFKPDNGLIYTTSMIVDAGGRIAMQIKIKNPTSSSVSIPRIYRATISSVEYLG